MLVEEGGEGGEGSGYGCPITPAQVAMTTSELHQLRALGKLTAELKMHNNLKTNFRHAYTVMPPSPSPMPLPSPLDPSLPR